MLLFRKRPNIINRMAELLKSEDRVRTFIRRTKDGTTIVREHNRHHDDRPQQEPAGSAHGTGMHERPGLRVAGRARLPKPKEFVGAGKYAVGEDQRLAINLALTRFENGGKGFLLADGAGTGKTQICIITAAEMEEITGKPSLIITANKQVAGRAFAGQAERHKLPKIEVRTYDDLRAGKIRGEYGCVVYDEAHFLKNADSARSKAAGHVRADHVVFSTATPMDSIAAGTYFLAAITGFSEEKIKRELGVKDGKDGLQLTKGSTWEAVAEKLADIRDSAIESGAMIRRVLPFWGTISTVDVALPGKAIAEHKKIEAHYAAAKDKKAGHAGQELLELSRWLEPYKIETVWQGMQADLKAGRKVIICSEGVNPTGIKGLSESRGGTIGELAKRLEKTGIPFAKIYGDGDKTGEVAKFQDDKCRVALMTPQSGGVGVSLDDSKGDGPRTMYVTTPHFAGDVWEQLLYRVSRRKSQSPSEIKLVFAPEAASDRRRKEILAGKTGILHAMAG